ncbi:MAG: CocE/NonD family hydrolase [Candidatus Abyssobacteria bacterium SURF_5]|uniref:CocE/NonD family hydrolase n=1 Tax=Abyssobacteria bacterium (strain SURF_5) TaxID=2093360 RepID=A0A3A4MZ77_ABYX5|nr:MAG: CocE/NonD family hydrolase [Candidatus Abyssubacteria bacterium SURF_5]
MVTSSFYLTMRDGVKIAVDLHLPKGLPDGEKIPTIIYQTRYIRSLEYRWPFSLLIGTPNEVTRSQKFFTSYGYAWVSVDARGSGASFGSWPYPYAPDEIKDGAEIVDWIIRQPWSDGKVGTFGTSYTGSTSEFLLVNNHPAVKAAAPRFSLFDGYTDIAFPGGIHQTWFTEKWAAGNLAIDTNTITDKFGLKVRMMVRGIKPVDKDKDRSLLAAAIKDHEHNGNVHTEALGITFRDDVGPSGTGTADSFSAHVYLDKIESSGAAVYCYSGWYDGAYQHSAIKRYLSISNPTKLIIGPWDHGGRQGISPWGSEKPEFNHDIKMLRFFDYHLKGIDNGIMREKPIYYFTMGEEKWKWADAWPLPNQETRRLYLSAGNGLAEDRPTDGNGRDEYTVDYTAGTGSAARWNSLTGPRGDVHFGYPNRTEEDKKLLCYTSAPLAEEMEVTGHPIVTLYVTSTESDGNFLVYLEDVSPDGHVTYVTEGQLRAIHRKVSDAEPPYRLVVPYHTFKREDAMPLVPGEVAELQFDLLPTSYLYKKGHSIRIAIAGADADHFALLKSDPPPALQFQRNEAYASAIDLPVIPR